MINHLLALVLNTSLIFQGSPHTELISIGLTSTAQNVTDYQISISSPEFERGYMIVRDRVVHFIPSSGYVFTYDGADTTGDPSQWHAEISIYIARWNISTDWSDFGCRWEIDKLIECNKSIVGTEQLAISFDVIFKIDKPFTLVTTERYMLDGQEVINTTSKIVNKPGAPQSPIFDIASILLGEDSAFQAVRRGSNPRRRSNLYGSIYESFK